MSFSEDAIFIAKGAILTLELTFGGVLLGVIFGLILAIMRYNGYLTFLVNAFISIIRGTPLLLQLSFFYFAMPIMLNIKLELLSVGIIAFGLNSSAYVAEIFRAGIESIPRAQFEAAESLQITPWLKWRDIILPQVLRNVLPALINEVISLLKETAIISMIGGMDLMRRAQVVAASQFTYFTPICIAGICYYILVLIIERVAKKIERKNA